MTVHPPSRSYHLVALLLAFITLPASAQVQGTVVDAAERPVPGATVELWAASRPAAATRTDDGGRFVLPAARADGPLMLTVRRLGLRTQTFQLASADTAVVVRMEPEPVRLLPVAVTAARGRMCPNREDPRARALWERMRSRYWQPSMDSVFVFGFVEKRSGVGEKADADHPEAGRVSTGWTQGPLVIAHPAFMARSGYATSASGGVGERTAFWAYRALDQGTIQDFTGDYFGTVHTFSLISQGPGEMTIGFCPRGRMATTGQIEGALVLRPDTTLSWARWRFRTPRPDEDAGGEASYDPPDLLLGRALLSRQTLFWRRTGHGRYYFEAHTFTGWRRRFPPVTRTEGSR